MTAHSAMFSQGTMVRVTFPARISCLGKTACGNQRYYIPMPQDIVRLLEKGRVYEVTMRPLGSIC
jgi:hypothetical protein